MKFFILKEIKFDSKTKKEFINRIQKIKNKKVEKLLNNLQEEGFKIILATAAQDNYVPWIWNGPYVATKTEENHNHEECRGEKKLIEVKKLIGDDGDINIVITDHYDDLPLIKAASEKVIMVSPNKKTLKRMKEVTEEIRTTQIQFISSS